MKKLLMVMLMFVFLASSCSFSSVSAPGTSSLPASNCQVSPDGHAVAMLTSDFQVDVYGQRRIVLDDLQGNLTELYVGNALPYVYPSPDNKFVLFVDRDCSQQGSNSTTGMRDSLWLVEVPSGRVQLLYSSATSFNLYAELALSPDGHFLAGLEGSGIGDECSLDSKLVFIEIPVSGSNATSLYPEQFDKLMALARQGIAGNAQHEMGAEGRAALTGAAGGQVEVGEVARFQAAVGDEGVQVAEEEEEGGIEEALFLRAALRQAPGEGGLQCPLALLARKAAHEGEQFLGGHGRAFGRSHFQAAGRRRVARVIFSRSPGKKGKRPIRTALSAPT